MLQTKWAQQTDIEHSIQQQQNAYSSQVHMEHPLELIDHMLGYKTSLNKFKIINPSKDLF